MRRRRRGHILRLDGPGRTRVKLAQMIEAAFGCICDPGEMWTNNYPAANWEGLCRWGVTCRFPNGLDRNVHSWSTMTECVREGVVAVGNDIGWDFEVTAP